MTRSTTRTTPPHDLPILESMPEARRWFDDLSDEDWYAVVEALPPLHPVADWHGGGIPGRAQRRRAVPKLRKHVKHLPDLEFTDLLATSFGRARELLLGRGYTRDQVEHPDLPLLRRMLEELPDPLARLVLHALLTADSFASPVARAHRAELFAVIEGTADPADVYDVEAEAGTADGDRSHEEPDLWSELRASVTRLRSDAVALAARLRQDAECVEAGRAPVDAGRTASLLSTFATSLTGLLSRGAEIGADGCTDQELTTLDHVLAAADAAEARARHEQDAEQERAELRDEHARLTALIATASPRLRAAYKAALLEVESGLAELGASVAESPAPEDDDHAEPARSEDEPIAAPVAAPASADIPAALAPPPSAGVDEEGTVVAPSAIEPSAPASDADEPGACPQNAVEPKIPDVAAATPAVALMDEDQEPGEPNGASVDDLRLAFPWDAGDPPTVASLVAQGRLAEAYWVTRASDESPLRADVLQLAYLAFTTVDTDTAGMVLTGWNVAVNGPDTDRDAFLVELAALLRVGLVAGWTPRPAAVEALTGTLDEPWFTLLDAAAEAVRRKGRLDVRAAGLTDDSQAKLTELHAAARRLQIDLPLRKTQYQRATLLLPVLLNPEQPLGTILDRTNRWSAEQGTPAERAAALSVLRAQLDALTRPGAITDLIASTDAATRGPTQREPIHSGALRQLERAARQVLDCGRQAVTLAASLTGPEDGAAQALAVLGRAAAAAAMTPQPSGVGGAALAVFARWIKDPTSTILGPQRLADRATNADDVPDDVLLVLPDLPRDVARRPLLDNPTARVVLAGLQDPRDGDETVREYCRSGMLDLADRLSRASGTDDSRRAVAAAAERWRADTSRLREQVQALFEKVWMQNLVTDDAVIAQMRGRLAARALDGAAAYDMRAAELRDLQADLQSRLDQQIALLRAKAQAEVPDAVLRRRIEAVLDDQDVVTAHEFLAAQAGDEPIDAGVTDPAAILRDFVAGVRTGVDDPADPARWAELFRGDRTGPVSQAVEGWFENWARLREPAGVRASLPYQAVQGVLRLLGLDPEPRGTTDLRLSKAFVVGMDVDAHPRDGSIIAELGSKAKGRYRVLVVRDDRLGRSPLDDVEAGIDRPHIVLSMQPLTLEQRARAAQDARARRLNAILVDAAVLGFVAARAPSSFRTTQQLTLPWTDYQPYRPFVAGLLPKELFVGREAEREQIVAPDGAVFVYGGRQLGKSALLHQIRTDPGDSCVVVYLDVQALGRSDRPDRIWVDLAEQLRGKGVLRTSVSSRPGPDVLRKEVLRWLGEDDSRRILLLVDEADAFLTADSRELPSTGGAHNFPTVNRLKQLMEASERRFKVVFAGLHQVQRFVRLSNVPTPHGGSVLIGPLGTADAYRLVVEPLAALGYVFERPDLAWRLLAHTNFHPAPIQIICAELLSHLRRSRDADTAVPVVITAQDVDRTAASQSVREPIAERTRITFNLEDRYRVLAMLLARKSLDDDFGSTYPAADLLEEAAAVWPEGFGDGFDENRLAVYLDEMVGLGLLVRSGPRTYAMRSPNVVSMLGNRQYFERELQAGDFENAYAYHPGSSRRLLGRSTRGDMRSPFTDEELHRLVSHARDRVVPLVTGCPESAVERLQDALRSYLEAEGGSVVGCGPEQLTTLLSGRARSAPSCLVVDLRGAPEGVRDDALDRSARSAVPVVALVDPDDAVELVMADSTWVVLSPERWDVDSVRAWPDCPYDTPDRRRRLIEVTAGWPRQVEAAVHGAGQPRLTTVTALDRLREVIPRDAQDAERILTSDLDLDSDLLAALSFWAAATEPGEEIGRLELPGVLSMTRERADRVELRLRLRGVLSDSPTGVRLDELTHRCLNRIVQA